MDSSQQELDALYELHKAVFDNDLKKLNQILRYKKEVVDKKVREIANCLKSVLEKKNQIS